MFVTSSHHSQVDRVRRSSCELNKDTLTFRGHRVPRGRPLHMLMAIDSILSMIIVTKSMASKG